MSSRAGSFDIPASPVSSDPGFMMALGLGIATFTAAIYSLALSATPAVDWVSWSGRFCVCLINLVIIKKNDEKSIFHCQR